MRYFVVLVLGIALGVVALPGPGSAAPRNLLVDGDFSAAGNPHAYTTFPRGSHGIPGWVVTKATVDLIGDYWKAPGGKRSVDLDGTPGFGAIAQSFPTVPGRTYTVSFLFSGNGDQGPAIKRMRVSAAGHYADLAFNVAPGSAQQGHWTARTWKFTARGSWTTLQFASLDTVGGYCGPVIAKISVTQ